MKNDTKHILPYQVRQYTSEYFSEWNAFLSAAKNTTFLFHRDFMEYHEDRFMDHSLLIFKENKLMGLLPANMSEGIVISHQGLSYGGLVVAKKAKFSEVMNMFKAVLSFLSSEGLAELHLKTMPKIYCQGPSDEMDYLLFLLQAEQKRVDLASTIDLKHPLKIQSNRMEGVKKAKKQGLSISEGQDFLPFWNEILVPNLKIQHKVQPVHSLEEIAALASKFPKNIVQFIVYQGDTVVAGATIFEVEHLAHVQYISANQEKQQLGSLDFLFHYLITERYKDKRYFDFGISNENQGKNLNEGLLYWKECFGARSIAQSFYTIQTKNYKILDSVFI